MRLRRPISLALLTLGLASQASPQAPSLRLIQIGLKAAQADNKFALILVTDNHSGDLESSSEQVLADPRLRSHIVYVRATAGQDPDALKIAALVSDTLPPTIPVLVLITPTAQGLNALGGISGTPAVADLQQWLMEKICGVFALHLVGAPPMDADLTALCQPALGTPSAPSPGNFGTASAPLVQLPLSRAEADLSRLTRQPPHLAGTWKGTAQKIICGDPRGTAQLVLTLSDTGYKPPNSALSVGNVTGSLSIDGTPKGAFGADYGNATLQTNPLEQSFATAWTPLDLQHPSATPQFHHYLKLTAKDAWGGVGHYQTLTGAFFASDTACPQYGDQGRVLKAQLKKQ